MIFKKYVYLLNKIKQSKKWHEFLYFITYGITKRNYKISNEPKKSRFFFLLQNCSVNLH